MSADTDKHNLNQPHGAGLSIESLDIDAERVDHLLIVKAFADALDLVGTVNRLVPTQMEVKPGLIVLGLVLDTLTGRSPLYRLVEFFEGRDTGLLLGESVPANVFTDDTTGRVLDLLFGKRPVNRTYHPPPDRGMIFTGGLVMVGSGLFDKSMSWELAIV